ncbi:MAG: hypothetical protein IJR23_04070 [Lachnospiraceae bacterium]|nr:hypothetical protein [Lachnospiraceae bacterium]
MQINEIKNANFNNLTENINTASPKKINEDLNINYGINTKGIGSTGGLSFADIENKTKMKWDKMSVNNADFVAGIKPEEMSKSLSEEGIDIEKEDSEVVLTVVDKIKIQRAIGGATDVNLDEYSRAELERIAPGAVAAYKMAEDISTPTIEEAAYMITNDLQPTLENVMKAENVMGNTKVKTVDTTELTGAIEKKVAEFVENPSSDDLKIAANMVALGVELNENTFTYAKDLTEGELLTGEDELTAAINEAVFFGFEAKEAVILKDYSYTDGLKNITNDDLNKKITLVSAKRRLMEATVKLSEETNLTLLKKGMHIDTEGIQRIVEGLAEEEETLKKAVFGEMENAEDVFDKTNEIIKDIESAPAYVLPKLSFTDTLVDVNEKIKVFTGDANNKELGEAFENKALDNASKMYDTMRTEIRIDLGDSIKKAFSNVPDILNEMNMDVTAENMRAVRILGYNNLEITEESVTEVKAADQKWQNVLNNLTPKVVLSMIRENYNPLNVSIDELNEKALQIKDAGNFEDNEKFSKFLYDLQKHNEISETERESFIGIYRLLRQVEKTDGAAIGAAVANNSDLTLKNLLTNVRTRHTGHVDKKASDDMQDRKVVADLSITKQVNAAYNVEALKSAVEYMDVETVKAAEEALPEGESLLNKTPEELLESLMNAQGEIAETTGAVNSEDIKAAESKETIERFNEAMRILASEEEVRNYLDEIEVPKSVINIEAAYRYFKADRTYSKLYNELNEMTSEDALNFLKSEALRHFEENIESPVAMGKALEDLEERATEVMDTMENEEEVGNLNIAEMRSAVQEIGLFANAAKKEDFAIPVLIRGEMGTVSLKIVKGKKDKAKVTITSHLKDDKKIAAEFTVGKDSVKGYAATDDEGLFSSIKDIEEFMKEALKDEEGIADKSVSLSAVLSDNISIESVRKNVRAGMETAEPNEEVDTKTLYKLAKNFIILLKR